MKRQDQKKKREMKIESEVLVEKDPNNQLELSGALRIGTRLLEEEENPKEEQIVKLGKKKMKRTL